MDIDEPSRMTRSIGRTCCLDNIDDSDDDPDSINSTDNDTNDMLIIYNYPNYKIVHNQISHQKQKRLCIDENRSNVVMNANHINNTNNLPYQSYRQCKSNLELFTTVTSKYIWSIVTLLILYIISGCWAGFACLSNPCVFGVCIDDLNSTYSCYCIDGYTGVQCQTNWDECWSAPCQNGAVCIDGVAHYNCSCPEGFVGQNCEENLDECLSNPCQNGGFCNDRDNGYTCTCPPGYLGSHCEIDMAVCETGNGERCQNGGECIEGRGLDYACNCLPGWQGRNCEMETDECESSPCQNGGICLDKMAGYVCACGTGFTGVNCEEEVLVCADSPCSNSALCLMEEGIPVCYCVPDFHGEKCEYQYDECMLMPSRCINGGTCIDGVDDFSCSCPPGLTGLLCECLLLENGDLDCNYTAPRTEWSSTIPTTMSTTNIGITNTLPGLDIYSQQGEHIVPKTSQMPITTTTDMYSTDLSTDTSTITTQHDELPYIFETSSSSSTDPIIDYSIIYSSTETILTSISTDDIAMNTDDSYILPTERTTVGGFIYNESSTLITSTDSNQIKTSNQGIDVYDELTTTTLQIPITSTTESETSSSSLPSTVEQFFTDNPLSQPSSESTTQTQPSTIVTTDDSVSTIETTSSTLLSTGQVGYTDETLLTTQTMPSTLTTMFNLSSSENYPTDVYTISYTQPSIPVTRTDTESTSTILTVTTTTTTTSTTTIGQTTEIPNIITVPSPKPTQIQTTATTLSVTPSVTQSPMENSTGKVDCIRIPCFNGGTCIGTGNGMRCACHFDHQGDHCEQPIQIRIPAFNGDSYLSHRINTIPLSNENDVISNRNLKPMSMQVELKARTRSTDGLLLLAIAQGIHGNHYMALFLRRGLLQFQFSCGLQTMLLSELETPINRGHEIRINAELDFSQNYTHCNASLRVNDTLAMSGDQPTWINLLKPSLIDRYFGMNSQHIPTSGIISNTWLHLGGTPQAPIDLINNLASGQGFTGCLHSLKINGEDRNMFSDAVDGLGISECGSLACLSNPCRNGAVCVQWTDDSSSRGNRTDLMNNYQRTSYDYNLINNAEMHDRWKCKCPTGYTGPTCEISICDDNPCQYGATCVPFSGSGYLCLCPLGKHGHYCEHNLEVAQPHFSGSVNGLSSYVAYPVPLPLEYSIELSLKILPTTVSQISLLAFLGQTGYHDEKSDHLALSFIQGYVMLTWNLGAGPRRIFTQKPVDVRPNDDGRGQQKSIEIRVGRIGRQAWLWVDGKTNITGRAPGTLTRMDVLPVLYLGGHEMANFTSLPHDLPLHSGFQGCIFDVKLQAGLVSVPLQETRGIRGRGVGQCGTRECHRHACQNSGACLHHGATFSCICQDGWYGPLCAQSQNPCDVGNNRCAIDSVCVPLVNGYECDCRNGKMGKYCDQIIEYLSDVSMTGRRSYLAIDWPQKRMIQNSQSIQYSKNELDFNRLKYDLDSESELNDSHPLINFRPINQSRFGMESTLMVTVPSLPQQHHRVQFFSMEFQIRPLSERGLLFYFGAFDMNSDRSMGFVSLSLQGGVVEFRVSSVGYGSHVSIVRSVRMLAIGEWHKIKVTQSGRRLTVWVEGSAAAALAPTSDILVDKRAPIFIGGLPDLSRLPYNAISGFPVPFRGCIRQLIVSGVRVVLNETNIKESRNVNDCDGTPCGGDSCESNGQCWLTEQLEPHCKCPEYAHGDRCEYQESCKRVPCKNNGRCLKGRCSCPNGWSGFYCEIAINKHSTPSFRGNSYLIVQPPHIPIKDKRNGPAIYMRSKDHVQVAMNFSTIDLNGLLFWSAKDAERYLGLGIESGHIKLASNLLGGGPNNESTIDIPSGGFVADGGWHNVQIEINNKFIELTLDGRSIFTENQKLMPASRVNRDNLVATAVDDLFYIGGFPDNQSINKLTGNRFSRSFTGCLQDISFGNDHLLQINDFSSYTGENIGSCDVYDDFI